MSDAMPELTSVYLNQVSDTAPMQPHFFRNSPIIGVCFSCARARLRFLSAAAHIPSLGAISCFVRPACAML